MGRLESRTTILPGFETGVGDFILLGRLESRTTILLGFETGDEDFLTYRTTRKSNRNST